MGYLKKLLIRTKEVATMYTGTFIVTMILNQLLFFGFCLNPICLIAAMPHVLAITVVVGTWLNNQNGWGNGKSETSVETELYRSRNDQSQSQRNLESLRKQAEELSKPTIKSAEKPRNQSRKTQRPADRKHQDIFHKYGVTSFWHITHRDNMSNILKKGIKSHESAHSESLAVLDISEPSVQSRRKKTDPIYARKLHDYVPLYFNPKNPMLYRRRELRNDICILEISIDALIGKEYIFTDGNAASEKSKFFNSTYALGLLPWDVLNSEYWSDFADGKRQRCSELLIYPQIEPSFINQVHCYSSELERFLHSTSTAPVNTKVSKELFF